MNRYVVMLDYRSFRVWARSEREVWQMFGPLQSRIFTINAVVRAKY